MGEKGRHPVVDRYVRPSVRPYRPVGVFIYVLIVVCVCVRVFVCVCVCVFVCVRAFLCHTEFVCAFEHRAYVCEFCMYMQCTCVRACEYVV